MTDTQGPPCVVSGHAGSRVSVPVLRHTTERSLLVQNLWYGPWKSSLGVQHLEVLPLRLLLWKPPPTQVLPEALSAVCRQSRAPLEVSAPRGDGRRREYLVLGNLSSLL